jgi:hypothetical protein
MEQEPRASALKSTGLGLAGSKHSIFVGFGKVSTAIPKNGRKSVERYAALKDPLSIIPPV